MCGVEVVADFNATPIDRGDIIWGTSVLKATGIAGRNVTFLFSDGAVDVTIAGQSYTIPVPDGVVTFSTQVTKATTVFDWSNKRWQTTVPANLAGNVLTTELPVYAPDDLPGGISAIKWSGLIATTTRGVSLEWRWAAAVYSELRLDTGVKPVDDANASYYKNADPAGTPESYKWALVPGARGTGGTNYTGSLTTNVGRCQF